MREDLMQDLENMEERMCRTAERCDIWQDRLIYAICKAYVICKAVRDILIWIIRRDAK